MHGSRRIRATSEMETLPVVGVTAYSGQMDVAEGTHGLRSQGKGRVTMTGYHVVVMSPPGGGTGGAGTLGSLIQVFDRHLKTPTTLVNNCKSCNNLMLFRFPPPGSQIL